MINKRPPFANIAGNQSITNGTHISSAEDTLSLFKVSNTLVMLAWPMEAKRRLGLMVRLARSPGCKDQVFPLFTSEVKSTQTKYRPN
jgi:hypothetical protein